MTELNIKENIIISVKAFVPKNRFVRVWAEFSITNKPLSSKIFRLETLASSNYLCFYLVTFLLLLPRTSAGEVMSIQLIRAVPLKLNLRNSTHPPPPRTAGDQAARCKITKLLLNLISNS
jgi:hypothetical protein